MKKDISFWILIILFILSVFSAYKIYSLKKDYQNCISTSDFVHKDNQYLFHLDSLQYASNGKKLNEDLLVENTDNQKVKLDSIMQRFESVAVLRFRESNCLDCNTDLLNYWNGLVDEHIKSRFVVLMQFQNPNNFKNFVDTKKIKGNIYNTRDSKINTPLESQEKPYVFILQGQKQIISPFIIDKTFIERTHNYFGFIDNYF